MTIAVDVAEASELSALTCEPASVGRWNDMIRRARFGRKSGIKKFALVLSSYADADGTNVRPGIARLATDAEIGESSARRYLDQLRKLGLVLLTVSGNRRAGRADEYRLVISAQFEQTVPSREEYADLINVARADNRKAQKERRMGVQRSPKPSAERTADVTSSALTQPSAEPDYQRSLTDLSALTMASAHLPGITYQQKSDLPAGGAPPPDPRRPTAAAPRSNDEQRPLCDPLTQAQDQEGESLPRTHASARDEADGDQRSAGHSDQCENGHPATPAGCTASGTVRCPLRRAQDRGVRLGAAA